MQSKKINFSLLDTLLSDSIGKDIANNIVDDVSVAVTQRGNGALRRFYSKEKRVSDEKSDDELIYRLASMTKPVTAAAALIQIDRGLLKLDDPVSKYIPSFSDMAVGRVENGKVVSDHRASGQISLLHLLTHTSGLLSADPVGLLQQPKLSQNMTLADVVDYYGNEVFLSDSPMERALYSPCAGMDVAARLVEITSGMSYADFLRLNIFEPLEMSDAVFNPDGGQWKRFCPMHNYKDGQSEIVDMGLHTFSDFPLSYTCGGGSLASTLGDYINFAQMLLNEGVYKGRVILSREAVETMRRPFIPESVPGIGKGETWGLGVRVIKHDTFLESGCFGWSGAYGTHFWVDPLNQITAVYMKNSFYDGGSGAMTARRFEKCVAGSCEADN